MAKPVLLTVDDNPEDRRTLEGALRRRYGADYRVLAEGSPGAGREQLGRLRRRGAEVALVLAALSMPGAGGVELLTRARELYPGARRGLLLAPGEWPALLAPDDATGVGEQIRRSVLLGPAEFYFIKTWTSFEERLYPVVGEALARWARAHRPLFAVVTVVGPRWSARGHAVREFLARNTLPHAFHDADSPEGRRILAERGLEGARLPVALLHDGRVLVDPSDAELTEAVGGSTHPAPEGCDLAVVGAGPAGLAAAVYGASEGLSTAVVEPEALGGQAGASSLIRNYLGFPLGVSGGELTARAFEQALLFGVRFVFTRRATGLRARGAERVVALSGGGELASRAVVLATGAAFRRLGVPALEALVGAGVFYGAVGTEAPAMRGEEVFVVGAGNSAGQAALHLAKFAARVTLLVRGGALATGMSDYLIRETAAADNVTVRLNVQVVGGRGRQRLEGLVLRDAATGATEEVPAAGLFVQIGAEPRTDWLAGSLARDRVGHVLTGRDLAPGEPPAGWSLERPPLPLETSLPGVFAAGDVRHGSVKRVAAAVGEGAAVVRLVHEYLAGAGTPAGAAALLI